MSADHPTRSGDVLLRVAFDGPSLAKTRRAIDAELVAAGVSAARAATFLFGINEILINAIVHGGGGGEVTLVRSQQQLVATVEDRRPTEPFGVPAELPPPEAGGGRGLWLAARACHSLEVGAGAHGACVVLTFDLGPARLQGVAGLGNS
jgi:serine/threonine-protein kinase RsbW